MFAEDTNAVSVAAGWFIDAAQCARAYRPADTLGVAEEAFGVAVSADVGAVARVAGGATLTALAG